MRDIMQTGYTSNKLAATTLKSTSRLRFRKQTEKERKDEGDLSPGEVELMDDPKWIAGAPVVIKAVEEWGQTILGGEYALLVDGLYGPHGLIASSPTWPALPGRPHFDSVFPFFSGHDLAIILRSMFRYLLHPCMYTFLLCAVAVQHNDDKKEHKTKFAPNFNFSIWAKAMISSLKLEKRNDVLGLMQQLANAFTKAGETFEKTSEKANLGDCVVFPSDMLHAAAAPQQIMSRRVVSYYSFVPKVVIDDPQWTPLLETLFSAEHVLDRRTMVDPNMLTQMMSVHGEDPLVEQKAYQWLRYGKSALVKGRVLS
jgi:hypothetical protein